ncbi:non-ribosomal peptide synthetase [Nocardia cyriacigeorgica]|uniref:non-ribosomal peptide synthetase n=1 Tax=Nocardia cyriacigeorgica TaxID=135487 RepID=UPI0013D2E367|nr:non-ribosomal peptide synthetase [Nocardia cyriacigeorgica]NEW28444.1 amino acid adenylation domain-containing protein [Nocardia cyriacigeorgica]
MSTIANDAASVRAHRTELVRRRIPASPGPRRPLTPGQSRAWFLQTREPADVSLNIGVAYRLSGALDVARLRAAVAAVAAEHDILRSSYGRGIDGEPYQVVRPDLAPAWLEHDLSGRSEAGLTRRVEVLVRRELARPFELSAEAPLRLTLIRTGAEEYVLVLVAHTIAWDDDSLGVFTADLEAAYNGSAPVRRAGTRFADRRGDDSAGLAYWRETLTPLPEPLELPGGPVSGSGARQAARRSRELPDALVQRVREFADASESTPTAVLLAAYSTLIHRYTAATDFLVAMPVSLRGQDAGDRIGYFGNTVLLRSTPRAQAAFADFAAEIDGVVTDALAHKHIGIDRVVHAINPDRTASRDGLEQLARIGFGVRSAGAGFTLDGVSATMLELGGPQLPVPLRVTVTLDPSAPRVDAEYWPDAFDERLIEQLLDHYLQLLDSALTGPQVRLGELDLFGPEARQRLLAQSRGELVDTEPATLVSLFERRVGAAPEAVAIIAPADQPGTDLELTYGALDRRANRLAHWLIAQGIGTEDIVALRISNSPEFIVAVLAVLKAGAAYLPIDPAYPDERIDFLIGDAAPRLVLGRVELDAAEESAVDRAEHAPTDADRVRPLRPDNLAYVIYTSGSTGTPKGVPVAHAAIADHLIGFCAQWGMTAEDRLLQSSSVSFDASLLDIFVTLTLGARLVIPRPDAFRDIGYVADLISRYGVTVLHMVPSLLSALLLLPEVSEWRALRHVPVGGEALLGEVADRFAGMFDAELRNHYGPTEAVVSATHMPVEGPQGPRIVPVGVPNRNVSAYLFDDRLQLVPAGAVGEIYLGGDQLARGYLDRPGLTAERFVPDPFRPGRRLYRTGDLARRNVSGELEFVGRADEQVKVRGYRIELGEVQAVIAGHPSVAQCVVVANTDRALGTTLAAYVVPAEADVDVERVRDYLAKSLPEFMIPSAFAVVDRIPLTEHGKLDKRALPEPRRVGMRARRAPATATEIRLAALFGEIFGHAEVGADDSFFELGGHSLLANRLVVRIRAEFGVEIDVRAPFDTPTVAGLAALIESTPVTAGVNGLPPLTKQPRPERVPLSHRQRAEWAAGAQGVVQAAVRITGPLDEPALTAALNDVIARHAALRTVFPGGGHRTVPSSAQNVIADAELTGDEPHQLVLASADTTVVVTGIAEADLPGALRSAAAHRFDPATAPLLSAQIFLLDENTRVLSLVAHRLVADEPSLRTVVSDLAIAYRCRIGTGAPPQWGPPAIDHVDYTLWQHAVAESAGTRIDEWQRAQAELPAPVDLADRADADVAGAHDVGFGIPTGLRRRLESRAEAAGATEFMLYQAAVAALLHKLGAGREIVLATPTTGRTDTVAADLVGPLASRLMLRTDLSGDPTLAEVLARARDAALNAFRDQDLPIVREDRKAVPQAEIRCEDDHRFGETWLAEDLHLAPQPIPVRAPRELTFVFTTTVDGEVDVRVIADARRYDAATIALFTRHLLTVLEAFAETPERAVSELRLMSAGEQERVLGEWSTGVEPSDVRSLGALFRHGRAVPGVRIALRCGSEQLTYGELYQRLDELIAGEAATEPTAGVDSLTHLLAALGRLLPPAAPVSKYSAPSAAPENDGRSDSTGATTGLHRSAEVGPLELPLTALTAAVADRRCVAADRRRADADPARKRADIRLFATAPDDPQLAADLLAALTDGATFVLATAEQRADPVALAQVIAERAVTQVVAAPTLLAGLAAAGVDTLPTVHRWDVNGIGWSAELPALLRTLAPDSVATFAYRAPAYLGAVARGPMTAAGRARPVPGARILILDEWLRPVAPGVLGEVYVGGIALATRFAGPEATDGFVADPFEPGERLFRTGDTARWTTDGRLAFAQA